MEALKALGLQGLEMRTEQSPGEAETQRRVCLTLWACAYEIYDASYVSDDRFDETARAVDLSIDTGRPDLDAWWRENFEPHTGVWIHAHPELEHTKRCTEVMLGMRPFSLFAPLTPGRRAELDRRFGETS